MPPFNLKFQKIQIAGGGARIKNNSRSADMSYRSAEHSCLIIGQGSERPTISCMAPIIPCYSINNVNFSHIISIVSCIVYLEWSHFDLHIYIYSITSLLL